MPRGKPTPLKLTLCKVKDLPSSVFFSRSLLRPSVYTEKLLEALAKPDMVIRISSAPAQIVQMRTAAKKLNLELLFARFENDVLVQIARDSEDQKRLLLLLRVPRSVDYLKAQKLELNLDFELDALSQRGLAKLNGKGEWGLTEAGSERLKA
jgi:hypothetical protein